MGFKAKLKSKLENIITEKELDLLPRGFQSIGKVMILKLNPTLLKYKTIIAQKCMELLPSTKSVYLNKGKVEGTFRKPNNIEYVAGEEKSLVKHKEHDVVYSFDFTKIMFSQGNLSERKYLATLVKDGEIIVDMFAGIGYFSLPIGKPKLCFNSHRVHSTDQILSYFSELELIELSGVDDKGIFIENVQKDKLDSCNYGCGFFWFTKK